MTPHDKQVMMFSATLAAPIREVCKKFMSNVRTCAGGGGPPAWVCLPGGSPGGPRAPVLLPTWGALQPGPLPTLLRPSPAAARPCPPPPPSPTSCHLPTPSAQQASARAACSPARSVAAQRGSAAQHMRACSRAARQQQQGQGLRRAGSAAAVQRSGGGAAWGLGILGCAQPHDAKAPCSSSAPALRGCSACTQRRNPPARASAPAPQCSSPCCRSAGGAAVAAAQWPGHRHGWGSAWGGVRLLFLGVGWQ